LIKAHKLHLASDRTSCLKATANQFRLLTHTAAYWLLHTLRGLAPKTSLWRAAQFDTFRLGLIKSRPAGSTRGSRLGSLSSLPGSRSPAHRLPHQASFALLATRARKRPPRARGAACPDRARPFNPKPRLCAPAPPQGRLNLHMYNNV
jgi:hypothetical protein